MKTLENRKFVKITALVSWILISVSSIIVFVWWILVKTHLTNYSNIYYFCPILILGLLGIVFLIYIWYYRRRAKKKRQSFRARRIRINQRMDQKKEKVMDTEHTSIKTFRIGQLCDVGKKKLAQAADKEEREKRLANYGQRITAGRCIFSDESPPGLLFPKKLS